jgi:hypothetical protein
MMKTYLLLLFLFISCIACNKDEKLTKSEHYKNLVYRIQSNDSNLQVFFYRLTYIDSIGSSRNIQKDTVLHDKGFYNIPVTLLKGLTISLRGISTTDSTFNLKIVDESGTILAETDTIEHWPITPFDPVDRYVSTIYVELP